MSATTQAKEGNSIDELVGVLGEIKKFETSDMYSNLGSALDNVGRMYFHSPDNKGSDGKLILDDAKAKDLAKKLWTFAAEYIAQKHLGLTQEKIDELKGGTDTSGKSHLENLLKEQLGMDEDSFYEAIKTRGKVTYEEFTPIIAQLPQNFLNVVRSKILTKKIDNNETAQRFLGYLEEAKMKSPQTFEDINVAKTFKSVQEVQGLVGGFAQRVPKDYGAFLKSYHSNN